MTSKQKVGCAFAIIRILVTSPIWFYLLYKVLYSVQATDLMWFLYWVYVPVGFLVTLIEAIFTAALSEN